MTTPIVITDAQRICANIRRIATGRVEWRVQHPVEKSYCMVFSRHNSLDPEHEAREWLADHKRRFPGSQHAGYEVAEVRVYSELERAALEAADALAAGGAGAPAEPPETPAMPQYWSVSVEVDGRTLISIGHDWLSGDGALEGQDEQTIIGAAQHLLSFVGYGLPPCTFDPDDSAQGAQTTAPADHVDGGIKMVGAAPASTPGVAERCPNCDDTGDVHSIDGQWRGACHCPAGADRKKASRAEDDAQRLRTLLDQRPSVASDGKAWAEWSERVYASDKQAAGT